MRTTIALAAVLLALGIAGCQTKPAPPPPPQPVKPSSSTPFVNIADGLVKSVTPDPLAFAKDQGKVKITWSINAGGYRFAAKQGIFIDGELIGGRLVPGQKEIIECQAGSDRLTYSCVNLNSRKGTYKYTVNLETADGKPLKPFDPTIANW